VTDEELTTFLDKKEVGAFHAIRVLTVRGVNELNAKSVETTGVRVVKRNMGMLRQYKLVHKRRFCQWFAALVEDRAPYRNARELLQRFHIRRTPAHSGVDVTAPSESHWYEHDPAPDDAWEWSAFLSNLGVASDIFERMVGAKAGFTEVLTRGSWVYERGCWRVGCPALSFVASAAVKTFAPHHLASILRRDVSEASAAALERALVRAALEAL
jgi:hypothetical protein